MSSASFLVIFPCSTFPSKCPIHWRSFIFHPSLSLLGRCWDRVKWKPLRKGNKMSYTIARWHKKPLILSNLLYSSFFLGSIVSSSFNSLIYFFPLFHFTFVTVFVILPLVVSNSPPAQGPLSNLLFLGASWIPKNSNLLAIHLAILQASSRLYPIALRSSMNAIKSPAILWATLSHLYTLGREGLYCFEPKRFKMTESHLKGFA